MDDLALKIDKYLSVAATSVVLRISAGKTTLLALDYRVVSGLRKFT